MAKNTTATGSVIDGVTVVHPDNIGKGIKWNPDTKQYEVSLGSGLYFDENGVIQMQSNDPVVKTFDNGTGKVYHRQIVIDYGSVLEVSGRVVMPLPSQELIDLQFNNPTEFDKRFRELDPTKPRYDIVVKVNAKDVGLTSVRSNGELYYTETRYDMNFVELGIKEVLSVSVTSGDTLGYRAEGAWAIDTFDTNAVISIGNHVYYLPEEDSSVVINYTIKGIKA